MEICKHYNFSSYQ